jgi:hypothetical protein
MPLLAAFNPLRLKVGFVLRAYHFRSGGNGNGLLFAAPTDAPFLNPTQCDRDLAKFAKPPIPPSAVSDLMSVIEGDGSPWSYLCASIFAREAAEFGALWHGCTWSDHWIIDAQPAKDEEPPETWQWFEAEPQEWRPTVTTGADRITVTFHTYSGQGGSHITRRVDTYQPDSYCFEADSVVLAQGSNGFIY